MGKSKVFEHPRKLQLLIVGGDEEDFASFRLLWTENDNDQSHLRHATSATDARAQLEKKSCDLLLCSHKLPEDDVLRLLRQMRENDARVSVSLLSDHAGQATIEALARTKRLDRATGNIGNQRRRHAEPQRSQKMDAIEKLAGTIAHDFNNLLLVICGYAELMLDSLAENQPLHRNVIEIMNASRRATDLTRQLLALSCTQTPEASPVLARVTTSLR
jgi:signal transduction histidine kinase